MLRACLFGGAVDRIVISFLSFASTALNLRTDILCP
jgi:hypothetical protein